MPPVLMRKCKRLLGGVIEDALLHREALFLYDLEDLGGDGLALGGHADGGV